jgi:hypothetical protein
MDRQFIRSVLFGEGSKLQLIEEAAFHGCFRLTTIDVPSGVREIGFECFAECAALSRVRFLGQSILRLNGSAFFGCCSLVSFCVPSSIEFIAEKCFTGCDSLSTLSFELPSHLRELRDLPLGSLSVVDIPDSVEILEAITDNHLHSIMINFGRESQLKDIRISGLGWVRWTKAFLRLPAHRLKLLRRFREFTE